MPADYQDFVEMKRFLNFDETDVANLKSLAPTFVIHGPGVTDRFYETLGRFPETAKLIDGRIDALKATHAQWMSELFAGDYEEAYFDRRVKIGMVHVRIGLPPYFVEAVMNFIRTEGLLAIHQEHPNNADTLSRSLLKILDLDLILINMAYSEERLDRVAAFTGMSRKLIENVITRAKKKK